MTATTTETRRSVHGLRRGLGARPPVLYADDALAAAADPDRAAVRLHINGAVTARLRRADIDAWIAAVDDAANLHASVDIDDDHRGPARRVIGLRTEHGLGLIVLTIKHTGAGHTIDRDALRDCLQACADHLRR